MVTEARVLFPFVHGAVGAGLGIRHSLRPPFAWAKLPPKLVGEVAHGNTKLCLEFFWVARFVVLQVLMSKARHAGNLPPRHDRVKEAKIKRSREFPGENRAKGGFA